jgi:hypothetical protein
LHGFGDSFEGVVVEHGDTFKKMLQCSNHKGCRAKCLQLNAKSDLFRDGSLTHAEAATAARGNSSKTLAPLPLTMNQKDQAISALTLHQ